MHLKASILLLSTVASVALAQADYPPCVRTCIEENPTSSFCTGDETGAARDECTCVTLETSRMVECIRTCPEEEKAVYKGRLPELCADAVIPGVSSTEEDVEGDDPAESGTSVTDAATTTASPTGTVEDATTTEDAATTEGTATAEETTTGEAAATPTGMAARGMEMSGILALGGGLLAMLAV